MKDIVKTLAIALAAVFIANNVQFVRDIVKQR